MRAEPGIGGGNAPFSLVERQVATRYLRAKKNEGGVALIAGISFACIALAIAAMIVIMSVMNGFRSTFLGLTLGAEGHMYVQPFNQIVCENEQSQLERDLLALDGVTEAFCHSVNLAGASANEVIAPAQVQGIRPDDLRRFSLVSDNIVDGSLQGFGEGRGSDNQILVGRLFANQMGLFPGDKLTLYSGRTRTTIAGSVPLAKAYTVGGIFETGLFTADYTNLFMDLNQAQLFFNDGEPAREIQLRLESADRVDAVRPDVRALVGPDVLIEDWKRGDNQSKATALRTEQIVMRLIFMIVVIIATFPVLAAMIMLVKNKSRDIAILRTVGATRGSVLRIFFLTGAIIGILGTIFGLVVGVLFCVFLGDIQGFFEGLFNTQLFPPSEYGLSDGKIPVRIDWKEIGWVALWGVGISFAATLLPALGASRTDPVEALRYE